MVTHKKKKLFYFQDFISDGLTDSVNALEFNWISESDFDVTFLKFHRDGSISKNNSTRLDLGRGDSVFVSIEVMSESDNKRILKFIYDIPGQTTAIIDISRRSIDDVSQLIFLILKFSTTNREDIRKYGFRDEISFEILKIKFIKRHFLEQILSLKFYKLETSINRVGKDNVFTSHLLIEYRKSLNIYFIRLIYDFMVSPEHDKVNRVFKSKGTSEHAWSPSFNDRITEIVNADNEKVKIMEFVNENFNVDEGIRMNLLNIEF
jgi:hypothetical protein